MSAIKKSYLVILSPFLIIAVNFIVAYYFRKIIGKWAFVPIILIEWCLFMFFVLHFGGIRSINKWVRKPSGSFGWTILAVSVGLIPLPLFLFHFNTLSSWEIWLPWILLAIINPWIEEFYWHGLLLDFTIQWPDWCAVIYTSVVFAGSHAVFGVNSTLNSGFAVIISTFIMGVVWAIVYKKSKSLRWLIVAHFLVDFFGLSAPAFLDLWKS